MEHRVTVSVTVVINTPDALLTQQDETVEKILDKYDNGESLSSDEIDILREYFKSYAETEIALGNGDIRIIDSDIIGLTEE
jgi:hypothetical protein